MQKMKEVEAQYEILQHEVWLWTLDDLGSLRALLHHLMINQPSILNQSALSVQRQSAIQRLQEVIVINERLQTEVRTQALAAVKLSAFECVINLTVL